MEHSSAKDMTSGSPLKLILGFSVPMLLGLLFQQFYSMVDTAIVGKFLGITALAGVGSTGSVNFLIIGLCTGICNGFAIPVAQKFGAREESAMRKYVANAAKLAVLLSVVITILVVALCKPILTAMATPEDIYEYAYRYIVIVFAGIPFTFLYNLTAGILRALGDSKSPILFLGISSALNIGLDLLFILVFQWNVAGAAIATVLAQGISGGICLMYIKKRFPILHAAKEERQWQKHYVKRLLTIGIPMGLQYSITAVGTIVIQWAVNGFRDEEIIAGVTAAQKLTNLFFTPYDALGATMATYAGQNTGARSYTRVKQGLFAASGIGLIYAILACIAQFFATKALLLLFTDASETVVIDYAFLFVMFSAIGSPALVFVNVVRFTIQGMGFSAFAILAGVFEMCARTFAGLVLTPLFGYYAVCLAHPLAWIAADLFLIPAFFYCKHRSERQSANHV